jgi:hypothetical protein
MTADQRPSPDGLNNSTVAKAQHQVLSTQTAAVMYTDVDGRQTPDCLPEEWCSRRTTRLCLASIQRQPRRPHACAGAQAATVLRRQPVSAEDERENRLSYSRQWTPPGSTRENNAMNTSPMPMEPSDTAAASAALRASALPARRPCSSGAASFASRASVSAQGESPPWRQCGAGQPNAKECTAIYALLRWALLLRPCR